jgi:hypothetical protein
VGEKIVATLWKRRVGDRSNMPRPIPRAWKVARSVSDPTTRTVTRGCQKPTRLKVQWLSPASTTACAPHHCAQRTVATTSAPAHGPTPNEY